MLGVKLELQLPAYTTATAKQDLSRICYLHHSSRQHQILNPLSKAGDQTYNLMVLSQICFRCTTTGTPKKQDFYVMPKYSPFPLYSLFPSQKGRFVCSENFQVHPPLCIYKVFNYLLIYTPACSTNHMKQLDYDIYIVLYINVFQQVSFSSNNRSLRPALTAHFYSQRNCRSQRLIDLFSCELDINIFFLFVSKLSLEQRSKLLKKTYRV